jgi:Uri superfamily endonuclease
MMMKTFILKLRGKRSERIKHEVYNKKKKKGLYIYKGKKIK